MNKAPQQIGGSYLWELLFFASVNYLLSILDYLRLAKLRDWAIIDPAPFPGLQKMNLSKSDYWLIVITLLSNVAAWIVFFPCPVCVKMQLHDAIFFKLHHFLWLHSEIRDWIVIALTMPLIYLPWPGRIVGHLNSRKLLWGRRRVDRDIIIVPRWIGGLFSSSFRLKEREREKKVQSIDLEVFLPAFHRSAFSLILENCLDWFRNRVSIDHAASFGHFRLTSSLLFVGPCVP